MTGSGRCSRGGTIITLAGNGTAGYMDGPASSAEFFGPSGVAVDGAVDGNVGLYVADPYNGRIRKVYKSQVTSVAGGASDCCSGDGCQRPAPALETRTAWRWTVRGISILPIPMALIRFGKL
jgi:hypothetical protein